MMWMRKALGFADIAGTPLGSSGFFAQFQRFVWSVETLREGLISAFLAAIAVTVAAMWSSRRAVLWAGIVSVVAILPLALAGHGLAAVGDQEAARLGKELTPIGAERAGNKDGSIPEWKGGLPKGKHKLGDARVDPFAADKPMFSIDANNVDKYKDKLSDGAV